MVQAQRIAWLRCKNWRDGLFPTEYALECESEDRTPFTLFADKSVVRKQQDEVFLKVTLLDREGDRVVVLLPSDPYEIPTRIVLVRADQILQEDDS